VPFTLRNIKDHLEDIGSVFAGPRAARHRRAEPRRRSARRRRGPARLVGGL